MRRHNTVRASSQKLQTVIPNFKEFVNFITKSRDIVDTSKLAEFYCSRLFDLKLMEPRNQYSYDAESPKGDKIEIKHRFYAGGIPPGMEIDLHRIDYVFYVELDSDLLPKISGR